MNTVSGNEPVHWYQVPIMWMVVGIPLLSVAGGVVMILLAVNNDDGLVGDDYYKDGLEINRVLVRDQKALELGLKAQFRIANGIAEVRILEPRDLSLPGELEFRLLNATRQGLDQVVALRQTPAGNYQGDVDPLPTGRWYLTLSTADWRISAVLDTPDTDAGMLLPVEN